jgi:hypothetical protein
MHHLLEMTDQRQHRQDRLNQHPVVPFAAATEAQVGRLPVLLAEVDIGEDDHLFRHPVHQMLEGRAVVDEAGEVRRASDGARITELNKDEITRVEFSSDDQYFLVDYETAADEVRRAGNGQLIDDLYPLFSPDDQVFFVINPSTGAELWSSADGSPLAELPGEISSIHFSPDGSIYFVDYVDAPSEVRDTASSSLISDFIIEGNVEDLTFSPDGQFFFVSYENEMAELRSSGEGGLVTPFPSRVISFVFSPNSQLMYLTYADGAKELRYTQSGELLQGLNSNDLNNVIFSPDGVQVYIDYLREADELRQADGGVLTELGLVTEGIAWMAYERLLVWYADGRAYVLDLAWLREMGGQADELSIGKLIDLACKYPLKEYKSATDELGEGEPLLHACNESAQRQTPNN